MRILNGGEYDNDWDYDIYSIIFFNYYSKSLVKQTEVNPAQEQILNAAFKLVITYNWM